MTYNLLYYRATSAPCTHTQSPSARANEFKTIVKYVNPDILAVNELGSVPTNGNNILTTVLNTDGVTKYQQANYSNRTNPSSIVNMLFYDENKLALHSQEKIEKDLFNQNLVRVIDLYRMYYKDPQFGIGADTVFFTVIVAHLKAGNSPANRTERDKATDALMKHLKDNVADENVLFCGDFNIYTEAEAAYQNLVSYSDTSERFFDPINQGGNWNNTSAFANIHTQSTRSSSAASGCHSGGGMDDRFDFILTSRQVLNGSKKLRYVASSYDALGQDGLHFNQSINSGTNISVPSTVLSALYNFSDHLPVILKMDVKISNIGISEHDKYKHLFTINNPASDELTIAFNEATQEKIELHIVNLVGKIVNTQLIEKQSTSSTIDLINIPSGIYFLSLLDSNGKVMTTRRFIKR